MKKLLCLSLILGSIAIRSPAQLPDGATAPDFTFTDINGNPQHLYDYLNAGKYVALEISATWCNPCWMYHTSGVMDSMFTLHDNPGDQKWKVLFLEGDGNTTNAQLNGIGTTQGNWVAGSLFPIMNPPAGASLNDFSTGYDINVFPTLYLICPNKKVYYTLLNGSPRANVPIWESAAATSCGPTGMDHIRDANPLTLYPNPAKDRVMLYFSLNHSAELSVTVSNMIGQTAAIRHFGRLPAGDHSLQYDLSLLSPGIYWFTISAGNQRFIRKKVVIQ